MKDEQTLTAASTTNEAWLEALRNPERNGGALGELRAVLVRGLRAVLAKRAPRNAEAMAEDVAQEALLKILDRLDSFRGESRFTTWAQKIAVNLALSKLRRKRWENVSLDDLLPEEEAGDYTPPALSDADSSPENQTAQHLLVEQVERVSREDLTEHQRTALLTVKAHGMPMDEAARRLDLTRNALYKLIHDARKRLKQGLEKRGLSAESILAELDDR
jgi:RNA polymerase sigma-70 factor (ECF subfamily)